MIIVAFAAFAGMFAAAATPGQRAPQEFGAASAATVSIVIPAGLVVSTIYAIIYYLLLKRRNEHFKREAMLREGIIDCLREFAVARGASQNVAAELATLQSIHAEARARDDENLPSCGPF